MRGVFSGAIKKCLTPVEKYCTLCAGFFIMGDMIIGLGS